jgi:hypothetical protein
VKEGDHVAVVFTDRTRGVEITDTPPPSFNERKVRDLYTHLGSFVDAGRAGSPEAPFTTLDMHGSDQVG